MPAHNAGITQPSKFILYIQYYFIAYKWHLEHKSDVDGENLDVGRYIFMISFF